MPSVLVVDDEQPMRRIICRLLEDHGFTCLQAANGEQALQVLRRSPDRMVVVLDLYMPRISGWDVLNAVTADPCLAGRHAFILLTAAGTFLPQGLLPLLGQMDVPIMVKPFDLDTLLTVVADAASRLQPD